MPVRRPPPGRARAAGRRDACHQARRQGACASWRPRPAASTWPAWTTARLTLLAGRLRAPRPPDQPAQTIWWTALLLTAFVCLALERLWPERRARVAAVTVASLLVLLVPASAAAADGWDAIREGNAALDRGRTQEAIAAYRRAAQDTDAAAIAWFNVGVALAQAGRSEERGDGVRPIGRVLQDRPRARPRPLQPRHHARAHRGARGERPRLHRRAARRPVERRRARQPGDHPRQARARPFEEPPPPSPQDDLEKALQQVPQQSYAFTKGKKQQRPVTAGSDW